MVSDLFRASDLIDLGEMLATAAETCQYPFSPAVAGAGVPYSEHSSRAVKLELYELSLLFAVAHELATRVHYDDAENAASECERIRLEFTSTQ